MLPRVLHPAIVHPEVLPASDQCFARNIDKMPRLNKLRRSKHENVKCFNVNSEYTQYLLKNIKGLGALKPNILQLSNLRKIRPLALQTS